jgi:hypothetical protein
MPIIMALLGGLMTIAGSLVGRVLLALGLGYVTFKGFDLTVAWLLVQIKANFVGMPADVVSFLGWLWVDKAIGMIFSAYTVAMLAKLAGSANVTKMVTKGGS